MPQTLSLPYHPAGWQKTVQRLAATRAGSALLAPTLHHLDAPFIRLSKGRKTLTSLLTGLPVVTLTTLGARSGQPRSVPLVAIPMDSCEAQERGDEVQGNIILIASNFGRKQHPAWYYNLKANPQATLSLNGFTARYLAHEASGEEREECWQRAAFLYGGYNAYRQRASQRTIGVFVLSPEEGPAPAENMPGPAQAENMPGPAQAENMPGPAQAENMPGPAQA